MNRPLTAKTKADLIALLERLFPVDWLGPLLAGKGAEPMRGMSAEGERLSAAVLRAYNALTAGTAPLGTYATGTVRLSRTGLPAGSLLAGSLLWDINGERVWTLTDAAWTLGDVTTRDVSVISFARSYQANLATGTILGVKTPLPGPLWDTSLIGTVLTPGLAGGQPPALEEHCAAKGTGPQPGETAQQIRHRLRELPDRVTPAAVTRQIEAVNLDALLFEAWELAAFSDYWYTDGSQDLQDPTGLGNWPWENPWPTGMFAVSLPHVVVSEQDLTWLFTDYGHTDYQDGYTAQSLWGYFGDWILYDLGDYGLRADASAIAARVEATRPGGVRWTLEEG